MHDKLERLRQWFKNHSKVIVAFSGGVDSSLVLKVAVDQLGEGATAVLAVSESLPKSERDDAQAIAGNIGARLQTIQTTEVLDPRYQANNVNRCYFCKENVYAAIKEASRNLLIIDGMNVEDTIDVRPGRAAARELGVLSPLCELGFTKQDVRDAAKFLDLPNWNKPAAACLASRIPYGTPVSAKLLQQIEQAEASLRNMGLSDLRVRHHGNVARLEVPVEDFEHVMRQRIEITEALKVTGFVYVSLDLGGLRNGSANEVLRR